MPARGASSGLRNHQRIDIHQGNSILPDHNVALGRKDPVMTSAIPATALNFDGIFMGQASSIGRTGALGSPSRCSNRLPVRADAQDFRRTTRNPAWLDASHRNAMHRKHRAAL